MKKLTFALLLLLWIPISMGGGESGNGGRAVVIRGKDGELNVQLTDLWEARQPVFVAKGVTGTQYRYRLDEFKAKDWRGIYKERTQLLLDKADDSGPYGRRFAAMYRNAEKELATYRRNIREVCDRKYDAGTYFYSPVHQVIQAIFTDLENHEMCLSKTWTDHADQPNKAMGETHETAYLGAVREFHQHNSVATRHLVPIPYGAQFKSMSLQAFESLAQAYLSEKPFNPSDQEKNEILTEEFGDETSAIEKAEPWSTGFPGHFPKEEGVDYNEFELAYASSRYHSGVKGRFDALMKLGSKSFECDDEYSLLQRIYGNRGMGLEVQFFVVPPQQKTPMTFGPGEKWTPNLMIISDSTMQDLSKRVRYYGTPSPYAIYKVFEKDRPYLIADVYQSVYLSPDLKNVFWTFGGRTGKCRLM